MNRYWARGTWWLAEGGTEALLPAVAIISAGKFWGEFGLNQAFQRAQKRVGQRGAEILEIMVR